ncbi:hypothetical protein LLK53_002640 [Salmonella enterica subsp. enterica serovar Thompson]|nr:hypothetical protein [Salmonella enterica subsp. enterica serovar Thompson]
MSNNMLTSEDLDDETLAELIEFRRTTLKHHTDEGNKTQAVLHNMVLVALLELQEHRKANREDPVAWTDAEELRDLERDGYAAMLSLNRKDCEHADPRRQILLFTHPAPLRNAEREELQERRKADSAKPIYQWRERYEEGSLWDDCTKAQYDGFAKKSDCEVRILYTTPPAPVVPDDLLSMAASAIEDLLEHTDPNTSYYSGVWADVPGKLRAAMLQGGFRDLSQPVDPQVAEYEQIMLQGGDK